MKRLREIVIPIDEREMDVELSETRETILSRIRNKGFWLVRLDVKIGAVFSPTDEYPVSVIGVWGKGESELQICIKEFSVHSVIEPRYENGLLTTYENADDIKAYAESILAEIHRAEELGL